MIGVESYDERWKGKKAIYREKYLEQLVISSEGIAISCKENFEEAGVAGIAVDFHALFRRTANGRLVNEFM